MLAGYGCDALLGEGLVERVVLAVAEAVHRVEGRAIIGHVALGHADAAALEQRPHAVVAGLAVDVREVVGVGVRRGAVRLEEGREQPRPRVHVHDRGRREHAVEVEQPAADAAEVGSAGACVGGPWGKSSRRSFRSVGRGAGAVTQG